MLQSLILSAYSILVLSFVFFIIERLRPASNLPFDKNILITNLMYVATSIMLYPVIMPYIITPSIIGLKQSMGITEVSGLAGLALPFWVEVLIITALLDLVIYVRHRFTHYYMWSFHIIHHAPKEVNWWVKHRLHPVDFLVASMFGIILTLFLLEDSETFMMAALIVTLFDYFNHANISFSWPKPIGYILASPDFHKWHHARASKAINKNFSVVFSFWDVLFGSYYLPNQSPPKECGVFLEKGQPEVANGYFRQLLYPFISWRKVTSRQ